MFQEFTIKNFRTHRDTTIELQGVTLLVGSNNSGKTNLLAALQHFSRLISHTYVGSEYQKKHKKSEVKISSDLRTEARLEPHDYFPHRHRLSEDDPIVFSCKWKNEYGAVEYELELYATHKEGREVACKEEIKLKLDKDKNPKEFQSGYDGIKRSICLPKKLQSVGLNGDEFKLMNWFFNDLGTIFAFNLQSSYLKYGYRDTEERHDFSKVKIASQLGLEGGNLHKILMHVMQGEPNTYERFIASLRRFEASFQGLRIKEGQVSWLFDLGRTPASPDAFPPRVVSDGLLKAAAVALLSSMYRSPGLIFLEEIENGISQKNIGRFLGWLKQAAGTGYSTARGYNTQFIITSHNPSVLRDFSNELYNVYNIRLERKGFYSIVRNLNSSLKAFVELGTVEGEIIKEGDKEVVKISPEKLVELWYSGTIGGEID